MRQELVKNKGRQIQRGQNNADVDRAVRQGREDKDKDG